MKKVKGIEIKKKWLNQLNWIHLFISQNCKIKF